MTTEIEHARAALQTMLLHGVALTADVEAVDKLIVAYERLTLRLMGRAPAAVTEDHLVTRWLPVHFTEFQAQVVIDALDMYTEGSLGQLTQREVREGRAAEKKVRKALGSTGEEQR